MNRFLKWFVAYYILGLVLMNAFTVLRHSQDLMRAVQVIIPRNMSDPIFYLITLVWPLYLGFVLYIFATGNFG